VRHCMGGRMPAPRPYDSMMLDGGGAGAPADKRPVAQTPAYGPRLTGSGHSWQQAGFFPPIRRIQCLA